MEAVPGSCIHMFMAVDLPALGSIVPSPPFHRCAHTTASDTAQSNAQGAILQVQQHPQVAWPSFVLDTLHLPQMTCLPAADTTCCPPLMLTAHGTSNVIWQCDVSEVSACSGPGPVAFMLMRLFLGLLRHCQQHLETPEKGQKKPHSLKGTAPGLEMPEKSPLPPPH